jgi:DHA1 family inner membrane transport protein
MSCLSEVSDKESKGRLILPALTISRTAPQAQRIVTSLLLIEIGSTYGTSIGVTNQINTFYSAAAVVAALLMGFLSVRYKHRYLLVLGISLSVIATLGSCVAPTFTVLLFLSSVLGFAANMVVPMTGSLIGEHFPPDTRGKVMGWLIAGPAALYVIGYPIVNLIGDWKASFLLFALPLVVASLALTLVGVPDKENTPTGGDILAGYKGILTNGSALASLVTYGLGMGVWQISLSLSASFYRQEFSMSRTLVSYFTIGMALAYVAGALVSGRTISIMGLKRTTFIMVSLLGASTMIRFVFLNAVVAVVLGFTTCLFSGIFSAAAQGLNLEQVPRLRGAMMSMTSAFGSIGSVLSLSLGGAFLIEYGWGVMGLIIGAFGILAGGVLLLFAKDTLRT